MSDPSDRNHSRRRFLIASGSGLGLAAMGLRATAAAPALITSERYRPRLDYGLQFGDVRQDGAVVWSRSDRPSRLWVEVDRRGDFRHPLRLRGPMATADSDFTARFDLRGLPSSRDLHVRVAFEDARCGAFSAWTEGAFRTAPQPGIGRSRAIRFVWGGDVAGQGYGINPDIGGMRIFEAMRQRDPDFFLHSGDTIYADGPIAAEIARPEGGVWRNVVAEGVEKVAETLDEYRGRYRYNLRDENLRRFAAQVPQLWQWDDHEVVNNWSPSKDLGGDARYTEKNIQVLVRRARQAFLEYSPQQRWQDAAHTRIERTIGYGPLLDVFMLDMRSYRGPNTDNLQSTAGPDTAFLGRQQLARLAQSLRASRAVWKVVAADMPLGLRVPDGTDAQGRPRWEAIANGDPGRPLGRELEFADLLRAIRDVPNVVWLTADVHYCAAHEYHPSRAAFHDFSPFWEFVAGPLNAGSFGPNELDGTFGPRVDFQRAPPTANTSPLGGFQFFGEVNIDPLSRALTVDFRDWAGTSIYSRTLEARRGRPG